MNRSEEFVERALSHPGLARVREQLGSVVRDSIRLHPAVTRQEELPVGASRLGGAPDLPPGTAWPTGNLELEEEAPRPSPGARHMADQLPRTELFPSEGRFHLSLVAQLNLGELAGSDRAGLLPDHGTLWVFKNLVGYMSDVPGSQGGTYRYYGYLEPANWRAFYDPGDPAELVRVEFPPEIPEDGRFGPYALSFSSERTLPDVETCFIGDAQGRDDAKLDLTREEWSVYYDLRRELRDNQINNQMLGHSDNAQPSALESAYSWCRSKLFPELPDRKRLSAQEVQWEHEELRLLLQLDAVGEPGHVMGGRDGLLHVGIRERDLAARDFRRVFVNEQ